MAIPDFQTLMLPVLRSAESAEVKISSVVETLAKAFQLTPEERTHLLPSGKQTTFSNRVHWAKSHLKQAGLVELTRHGYFQITAAGRQVLANPPDKLTVRYLATFPSYRRFRDGGEDSDTLPDPLELDVTLTPDEIMRHAYAQLEEALANELMQRIQAGSAAAFEQLVVRLLVGMGYGGSLTEVSNALVGGTGDGGIDGVIDQDPLGLDRIYVQAKRYADHNTVGAAAIRDFFGSLDRFKATKGLFVTASKFSASARDTAQQLSKRMVLIDGSQLTRLMIRHGIGCRVEDTLYIKKVDEEFFE